MSIADEILAWHREMFPEVFPEACLRKAAVELGELIEADFRRESAEAQGFAPDLPAVETELGDVLICLHAYARRVGLDFDAALRRRWPEIKGRPRIRVRRNDASPLIRPAELQRLLGISRTTLWRWAREPDFPRRRRLSRGRVAWRRDEIAAWIEARTVEPGQKAPAVQ